MKTNLHGLKLIGMLLISSILWSFFKASDPRLVPMVGGFVFVVMLVLLTSRTMYDTKLKNISLSKDDKISLEDSPKEEEKSIGFKMLVTGLSIPGKFLNCTFVFMVLVSGGSISEAIYDKIARYEAVSTACLLGTGFLFLYLLGSHFFVVKPDVTYFVVGRKKDEDFLRKISRYFPDMESAIGEADRLKKIGMEDNPFTKSMQVIGVQAATNIRLKEIHTENQDWYSDYFPLDEWDEGDNKRK